MFEKKYDIWWTNLVTTTITKHRIDKILKEADIAKESNNKNNDDTMSVADFFRLCCDQYHLTYS